MDKISKSVFSHKSWDILCKVRDALKVNVYIVDCRGNIVISPEKRRYGGCILLCQSGRNLAVNILSCGTVLICIVSGCLFTLMT